MYIYFGGTLVRNSKKTFYYLLFVILCITSSLYGMELSLRKSIEFVVSPNKRFLGKIYSPFQKKKIMSQQTRKES